MMLFFRTIQCKTLRGLFCDISGNNLNAKIESYCFLELPEAKFELPEAKFCDISENNLNKN